MHRRKAGFREVVEITDSSDEEWVRGKPIRTPADTLLESKRKWKRFLCQVHGNMRVESNRRPPSALFATFLTLYALYKHGVSFRKPYGASYMRSRVVESSASENEDEAQVRSPGIKLGQKVPKGNSEKENSPARCPPEALWLKKQSSSMVVEIDTDSENENDGAIIVL